MILLQYSPSWQELPGKLANWDKLVTLSNNRAVTIYLWHNMLIALAFPIVDLLYRIPFMQSERGTAALDSTYEIWVFALVWPLIGAMILLVGWVEDLGAKRRPRLWPNGAKGRRAEPAGRGAAADVPGRSGRSGRSGRAFRAGAARGRLPPVAEVNGGPGGERRMSKRQTQKMLRLMASGEPVELTSPMASVKKLARLAFVAQQFGYEYADVRQGGGNNSQLKMLIVPDPSPQAQARAAQNWAQYPNAATGCPCRRSCRTPSNCSRRASTSTSPARAPRSGWATARSSPPRSVIMAYRMGGTSDDFVIAGIIWLFLMAVIAIGFVVTRKRNAKFAARLQAAGFLPVTDETGRVRYLPPGAGTPYGQPGPYGAQPQGAPGYPAQAPQQHPQAYGQPFPQQQPPAPATRRPPSSRPRTASRAPTPSSHRRTASSPRVRSARPLRPARPLRSAPQA